MFIVLDGIDGGGKSTQLELTDHWLKARGHTVTRCADPGSTELGLTLRSLLLNQSRVPICAWSEALLFTAARSQLLSEVIRPALARGEIVLCDRYIMSTIVYQGHAGGLPVDALWRVNTEATQNLWPDVTILLDLPADIARTRWGNQPDRMESRGDQYFQQVRQGFLHEAGRWPSGVYTVDATQTADEVQQQIQALIGQHSAAGPQPKESSGL